MCLLLIIFSWLIIGFFNAVCFRLYAASNSKTYFEEDDVIFVISLGPIFTVFASFVLLVFLFKKLSKLLANLISNSVNYYDNK